MKKKTILWTMALGMLLGTGLSLNACQAEAVHPDCPSEQDCPPDTTWSWDECACMG